MSTAIEIAESELAEVRENPGKFLAELDRTRNIAYRWEREAIELRGLVAQFRQALAEHGAEAARVIYGSGAQS